jgi:hypothetical protein
LPAACPLEKRDDLLRYFVHLILVIDGVLPELVGSGRSLHDGSQFCGGQTLNLHTVVERKHHDCRSQKENKNTPDAAKKPVAAIRPHFPPPVNPNPFVYLVRRYFHI